MKKYITYITAALLAAALALGPMTTTAYADEGDGQTETETQTETELKAVILPTDEVSTEDIVLFSTSCCVMDADSGQILYYKNMNKKLYPASITKVLSGLLLIENAASLKDKIEYSDDDWEGIDLWEDMNIGMLPGEKLSVEATLHAMLLSSANEVCNGAARYVAGSVEAFAEMMNERARELGCTNSHFVNPNGLHNKNHYTTAHDMAMISRAAINNETFATITGTTNYTVKKTNKRKEGFELWQKHKMLMWTDWHYDACIGGKTGYTDKAKNTLVTFARKDGHTLVCVTMKNADGHIYPDTIMALDYVFDNYEKLRVTMPASDAPDPAPSSGGNGVGADGNGTDGSGADGSGTDGSGADGNGTGENGADGNGTGDNGAGGSGSDDQKKEKSEALKLQEAGERTLSKADILFEHYIGPLFDAIEARMPGILPYLVGGIILFLLFIFWFFRFVIRLFHRRRFKQMRKKRQNSKKKEAR